MGCFRSKNIEPDIKNIFQKNMTPLNPLLPPVTFSQETPVPGNTTSDSSSKTKSGKPLPLISVEKTSSSDSSDAEKGGVVIPTSRRMGSKFNVQLTTSSPAKHNAEEAWMQMELAPFQGDATPHETPKQDSRDEDNGPTFHESTLQELIPRATARGIPSNLAELGAKIAMYHRLVVVKGAEREAPSESLSSPSSPDIKRSHSLKRLSIFSSPEKAQSGSLSPPSSPEVNRHRRSHSLTRFTGLLSKNTSSSALSVQGEPMVHGATFPADSHDESVSVDGPGETIEHGVTFPLSSRSERALATLSGFGQGTTAITRKALSGLGQGTTAITKKTVSKTAGVVARSNHLTNKRPSLQRTRLDDLCRKHANLISQISDAFKMDTNSKGKERVANDKILVLNQLTSAQQKDLNRIIELFTLLKREEEMEDRLSGSSFMHSRPVSRDGGGSEGVSTTKRMLRAAARSAEKSQLQIRLSGVGIQAKKTELSEKETELAGKKKELVEKEKELGEKEGELTAKRTKLTAKETKKKELPQIRTEIAQLEIEIAQLQADIKQLQADIKQLPIDIEKLQAEKKKLEAQYEIEKPHLEEHLQMIVKQEKKAAQILELKVLLDQVTEALKSDPDELRKKQVTYDARIKELESEIDVKPDKKKAAQIVSLKKNLEDVTAALMKYDPIKLRESKAAYEARIKELESDNEDSEEELLLTNKIYEN